MEKTPETGIINSTQSWLTLTRSASEDANFLNSASTRALRAGFDCVIFSPQVVSMEIQGERTNFTVGARVSPMISLNGKQS